MRCLGGCLFLHRVVVSSFFSSSSNNSTRSLDVIVVGRSKKPRKRVERLSPHLYKERDDSCLCAFGQNNKQIFPAKKQKKTPLSFITSCLLFRSHFPLLRSFASKTEGKSKNIFVLETGKKKECRQNQARANKTHARRKKKELARIKSTRTRASKGTR